MVIDSSLIREVTEVLDTSNTEQNKTVYYYGTYSEGTVTLDGSSVATPVVITAGAKNGDRVMVTIKDHEAIIVNNLTSAAVTGSTIDDEVSNLVLNATSITSKELRAEYAYIENGTIVNATIDWAKINDVLVTNAQIKDAAITTAKIDDAAITSAKIGDAQITNAKIATEAVDSSNIKDLSVTTAKIADEAVDSSKIKDLSVTEAKINDASITSAKIVDASITTAKIGDAQITQALIADGAVGNAQILELSADKITGGTIKAGTIEVVNLDVGYINGEAVKSETIDFDALNDSAQTYINSKNSSYRGTLIPTKYTEPQKDWDEEDYSKHNGDIYYLLGENGEVDKIYRFECMDSSNGLDSLVLGTDTIGGYHWQQVNEATNSYISNTNDKLEVVKESVSSNTERITDVEATADGLVSTVSEFNSSELGDNQVINKLKQSASETESLISALGITENDRYALVENPEGSPVGQGWYEIVDNNYILSTDTSVDTTKKYYYRGTVLQAIKSMIKQSRDQILLEVDSKATAITNTHGDTSIDYTISYSPEEYEKVINNETRSVTTTWLYAWPCYGNNPTTGTFESWWVFDTPSDALYPADTLKPGTIPATDSTGKSYNGRLIYCSANAAHYEFIWAGQDSYWLRLTDKEYAAMAFTSSSVSVNVGSVTMDVKADDLESSTYMDWDEFRFKIGDNTPVGIGSNDITSIASYTDAEQVVVGDITGAIVNLNNSKLSTSGGTMAGQLMTSFKNCVAIGSREADSNSISDLVTEVRYSSGCMGSAYITEAYQDMPATWYNYLYIPHRTGGINGGANGDNQDYGTLLMFSMTSSAGAWWLRISGGVLASVTKFI